MKTLLIIPTYNEFVKLLASSILLLAVFHI